MKKRPYVVKWLTASLIRVTSIEPIGPHGIVMWTGYPHDVDYDGEHYVDLNKLSILQAKQYQYPNSDITYTKGKADKVPTSCPSLLNGADCYCTGACFKDAPDELVNDPIYLKISEN